ncbi:5770_t:CDS:2 [Paraglomus occultum]|uniref:5770_t:CDS:1 n=1 Tax=Paraglomus occultum TaxID=144539 RepID=A0A9N8VSF1_9GLOM|nr:5770_t:CDS:2 [Paraglomus occultum]
MTPTGDRTASLQYPTLAEFLRQLNLTQYHSSFVEAGVCENDVSQLVELDEQDLKEIMTELEMKLMHFLAFKKGLRVLREGRSGESGERIMSTNVRDLHMVSPTPLTSQQKSPLIAPSTPNPAASSSLTKAVVTPSLEQLSPGATNTSTSTSVLTQVSSPSSQTSASPSLSSTTSAESSIHPSLAAATLYNSSTTRDIIIQHATIYGKRSNRQLTQYELAINKAAIELALSDPALVANKGDLFEKAKAKLLLEGYTYKRGQSRSKLNPNAPKPGRKISRETLRAKRNAYATQTSEARNARIAELERKLNAKDAQREATQEFKKTKENQGDAAGLEKATLALQELDREREEIVKELTLLKGKERKHQWYEKRKRVRMDSGFDESVTLMLGE